MLNKQFASLLLLTLSLSSQSAFAAPPPTNALSQFAGDYNYFSAGNDPSSETCPVKISVVQRSAQVLELVGADYLGRKSLLGQIEANGVRFVPPFYPNNGKAEFGNALSTFRGYFLIWTVPTQKGDQVPYKIARQMHFEKLAYGYHFNCNYSD